MYHSGETAQVKYPTPFIFGTAPPYPMTSGKVFFVADAVVVIYISDSFPQ